MNEGRRRKVTTVLNEDLDAAVREIEKATGMGIADLARVGLTKVFNEFRQTGEVKFQPLIRSEAAVH